MHHQSGSPVVIGAQRWSGARVLIEIASGSGVPSVSTGQDFFRRRGKTDGLAIQDGRRIDRPCRCPGTDREGHQGSHAAAAIRALEQPFQADERAIAEGLLQCFAARAAGTADAWKVCVE